MKATRQIFDVPQEKVQVCESGRILVAIKEEMVKSVESVPVGVDEEGEMRYSEHEKTQYAYNTYWLENPTKSADALSVAKQVVFNELTAYDASPAVNSFSVNGETAWLDKAIALLSKIEMYAMECYNRTAAHRQAIEELTDIADVLQYDFKEGYPNKLEITL